jgi:hypothetical protein
MTAEFVLGGTRLPVRVARLLATCPHFQEPLPYQVRSAVSIEVFRIFVAALEASPCDHHGEHERPAFTCEEFGFASLLARVTDFIETVPKKLLLMKLTQTQREVENLRKQFLNEQARWNEVMKRVMQHFLFTSDPPEQEKMPAGDVIAHLTAKCGGNVHDKGVVEITASSVSPYPSHCKFAPRNAADLGTFPQFCSEDSRTSGFAGSSKGSGSSQRPTRSGRTRVTRISII